MIIELKLRW